MSSNYQAALDRLETCAASECEKKADGADISGRKFCGGHGLALVKGERVLVRATMLALPAGPTR